MATDNSLLGSLLAGMPSGKQVGDWFGSPQASMMLGQGAQALSAAEPNSWQHQLGKVGQGMGQAEILKAEATKREAQRQQYMKMFMQMMGGGPAASGGGAGKTPPGIQGNTSEQVTTNHDGTFKRVLTGDGDPYGRNNPLKSPTKFPQMDFMRLMSGQGGGAPGGGRMQRPVSSPQPNAGTMRPFL